VARCFGRCPERRPTATERLHTRRPKDASTFFYQKAKTLLTPHNNCKKPKVKKQKSPLTFGKKS